MNNEYIRIRKMNEFKNMQKQHANVRRRSIKAQSPAYLQDNQMFKECFSLFIWATRLESMA